jgi:glycosyltransferase involved in cell wall biosynthesis
MVQQLTDMGIKVFVIETEQGFDRSVWSKVKKLIIDEKVDIVHAHGTRANSNVFWAAKSLKIPLIYTVHGWSFHPDQKLLVRFARKMSERFLTRISDSVLCVSESNQRDGVEGWGMKNSAVIYNGINTSRFDPGLKYKDIRKEFGISSEKTLIGYIVRITKQKDPLTLIRAMSIVSEKTKDVVLIMVGEGDLKESAIKMVLELNLSGNVIFENFRQDVPDILNSLDIYCLPSLWEGLPIGVIEAMAMGKVVIATPVDGTKEIISTGENGILFPVMDEAGLARAILEIHENKELGKKLSVNSIATVRDRFTIEKMVSAISDHYLKIVSINFTKN